MTILKCHTIFDHVNFAIFYFHLSYSCIVWPQNINTVRNFKDHLFHSSPLFSSNNILKFGDKIALENIFFVSKYINSQVSSIYYDWFPFSRNLHRFKTCWSVMNDLNIPTFLTQKYGLFSIRATAILSWNYTQHILKRGSSHEKYKILPN